MMHMSSLAIQYPLLRALLIVAGVSLLVFAALAFSVPLTAEANHCGGDVHASNGYCYSEEDMCDAGWTEYCDSSSSAGDQQECGRNEVLASDGNCYSEQAYCDAGYTEYCDTSTSSGNTTTSCRSGEIQASDGKCYDADLYDPQDLCDAGYSEYCTNSNINTSSCGSGEIRASDGKCYDANLYNPQDLCNAGYTQYCESRGSTTTYSGGIQQDAGSYGCPEAAEYANSREVDSSSEWSRLYSYASDHVCGSADVCKNISGDQYQVPANYQEDSGNCYILDENYLLYTSEQGEICSGGFLDGSGTPNCQNGIPECSGEYVLDVNGAYICVPPYSADFESEPDEGDTQNQNQQQDQTGQEEQQSPCPTGSTYQNGNCVSTTDNTGCSTTSSGKGASTSTTCNCSAGYTQVGDTCVAQQIGEPEIQQNTEDSNDTENACPNICVDGDVVNSCTGNVIESCSFSCSQGLCILPPSPELLSWTVLPLLVHRGDQVTLTWNTANTSNCTIARSSGISWTGLNSTGSQTDTILQETAYGLSCEGEDGTTLTGRTYTVRIVPDWQEI